MDDEELLSLIEDMQSTLPAPLGLRIRKTPHSTGQVFLYDDFGPVAVLQPDAKERVEAGLTKMAHLVKCAAAIAKENRRLKRLEKAAADFIAAARLVKPFDSVDPTKG